jgi:hypothetical protein
LALAACHDSTAPDRGVTGQWIHAEVDAISEFSLVRRGSVVTGTYTFSGIMGPTPSHDVSGTATGAQLHLEWTSGTQHLSFDAALPITNPNELVGRITIDGFEPGPLMTFHRIAPD